MKTLGGADCKTSPLTAGGTVTTSPRMAPPSDAGMACGASCLGNAISSTDCGKSLPASLAAPAVAAAVPTAVPIEGAAAAAAVPAAPKKLPMLDAIALMKASSSRVTVV